MWDKIPRDEQPDFRKGDRVSIRRGDFAGLEGFVTDVEPQPPHVKGIKAFVWVQFAPLSPKLFDSSSVIHFKQE